MSNLTKVQDLTKMAADKRERRGADFAKAFRMMTPDRHHVMNVFGAHLPYMPTK